MIPKYHIFFGFVFSSLLLIFVSKINFLGFILIFLSSFLIDADHYIYLAFKNRIFNPFKSVKYFFDKKEKYSKFSVEEKKKYYSGIYFLHGIEILIILLIMGYLVSSYFLFVFAGFAFHMLLDIIEQIYTGKRIDKISLVYDLIKFRKLKPME